MGYPGNLGMTSVDLRWKTLAALRLCIRSRESCTAAIAALADSELHFCWIKRSGSLTLTAEMAEVKKLASATAAPVPARRGRRRAAGILPLPAGSSSAKAAAAANADLDPGNAADDEAAHEDIDPEKKARKKWKRRIKRNVVKLYDETVGRTKKENTDPELSGQDLQDDVMDGKALRKRKASKLRRQERRAKRRDLIAKLQRIWFYYLEKDGKKMGAYLVRYRKQSDMKMYMRPFAFELQTRLRALDMDTEADELMQFVCANADKVAEPCDGDTTSNRDLSDSESDTKEKGDNNVDDTADGNVDDYYDDDVAGCRRLLLVSTPSSSSLSFDLEQDSPGSMSPSVTGMWLNKKVVKKTNTFKNEKDEAFVYRPSTVSEEEEDWSSAESESMESDHLPTEMEALLSQWPHYPHEATPRPSPTPKRYKRKKSLLASMRCLEAATQAAAAAAAAKVVAAARRAEVARKAAEGSLSSELEQAVANAESSSSSSLSSSSSSEVNSEEPSEVDDPLDANGEGAHLKACRKLGTHSVTEFLEKCSNGDTLQLDDYRLGKKGAVTIAVALKVNKTLERVSVRDTHILAAGCRIILKSLHYNTTLKELDLSYNWLGYHGSRAAHELLLQNQSLTGLICSGDKITDRCAHYWAKIVRTTKSLRKLDLSYNELGDEAGKKLGPAIAENDTLEELSLKWNQLRQDGALSIARSLIRNGRLKDLDLSWNGFADNGAAAVGRALKKNSTLESLNLRHNRISENGAKLLAQGIEVNSKLKHLQVGSNPIGMAGVTAILMAIKANAGNRLEELNLDNVAITQEVLDMLNALQIVHPGLKVTHGGLGGVQMRAQSEKKKAPMVLIKQYIDRSNLRLVDFFNSIDKNKTLSITAEELEKGLRQVKINLTSDQISKLVQQLDTNGDGAINYAEFVSGAQLAAETERRYKQEYEHKRALHEMATKRLTESPDPSDN